MNWLVQIKLAFAELGRHVWPMEAVSRAVRGKPQFLFVACPMTALTTTTINNNKQTQTYKTRNHFLTFKLLLLDNDFCAVHLQLHLKIYTSFLLPMTFGLQNKKPMITTKHRICNQNEC